MMYVDFDAFDENDMIDLYNYIRMYLILVYMLYLLKRSLLVESRVDEVSNVSLKVD